MERICTEKRTLLAAECDVTRQWKMPGIFVAMQEIADSHAKLLGLARDDMRPKDMIWMIARIRVEMEQYPRHADELRISTWPGTADRVGFPRYFTFEDGSGNALGKAASLWMVVDTNSYRLMSPAKANLIFPDTSDIAPPMAVPGRIRMDMENAKPTMRMPVYNDIDMNDHVNNARYVEWVTDLFDPERFKHQWLKSFQINYIAQIKYGQRVQLLLKEQGDDFLVTGTDIDRDTLLFEAFGSFMQRDQPIAVLP